MSSKRISENMGKYFPKNGKLFRNKTSESKNCSDDFYTLGRYVRWQSKAIYFSLLKLNKKHIKWKIHKVQLRSSTHYKSSEQ